jgi:hypothetical protein
LTLQWDGGGSSGGGFFPGDSPGHTSLAAVRWRVLPTESAGDAAFSRSVELPAGYEYFACWRRHPR